MDRQILNITANEQILTCDNPIKISTNKVNYIEAHFTLGDNWSGYDSVRAVWFNDFNCISTVLDSLGNCVVPFEVMKRKGNVKVNLVGSISEDDVLTDRLTSYPVVAVIVDCTAQITGANTSPITPSEFEQFAQRVHTDADRAEQGASEAETSAQNASDSATSAHNSAESAHDDKIAIEQAIAEVIQQIEDFEQVQVVVNTLPPSSQATSDFTDGVLTLGIPQGVKGDTGNGIQSIAKTGTSGLVDTYTITFTDGQTTTFNVTNGAKGDTGNGIQSIAKTSTVGLVDTYTITYTNGTTTTFTVTNGEKGDKGDTGEVSLSELEQATVVQTLSDNTPYNYRRTNNGNGAGHREYDEIVGASVGWNQLVQNGDFDDTSNWIGSPNAVTVSGHYGQVNASANAYSTLYQTNKKIIEGHKYFVCAKCTAVSGLDTGATTIVLRFGGTSASYNVTGFANITLADNATKDIATIINATSYHASSSVWNFMVHNSTNAHTEKWSKIMVTDLTLALGSTIADYIYSLEQSTAGSGVTWLKTHFPKLFDNGYQPYDSGSIKSVSGLTAHEMVGVNLFDITKVKTADKYVDLASSYLYTAPIELKPNTQYTISPTSLSSVGINDYWVLYINLDASDKDYLAITNPSVIYPVNGGAPKVLTFTTGATGVIRFGVISVGSSPAVVKESALNAFMSVNWQIELGSTATDYEPYTKHTYPLDSSVTLRGQYKLNNGVLYADGDRYPSSGQIGRTWDELDLGSLNWYKDGEREIQRYYTNDLSALMARPQTSSTLADIVVPYYTLISQSASWGQDKTVSVTTGGTLYFMTSAYSTSADFKASVNGVHMVYKKATPTTESATPYTSPQWCDSHGTEEYVGSELPVGHSTDYPMSLSDTVPTASGNYTLKCTVTNGKPVFTWVSV